MEKKKFQFHYAWLIFIAGFIMVFTVLGFCSSAKSLYLAPVTEDTGIPRAMFSLNDVSRYIVVGTMNIFFGRFVEKFNPRIMVAIGFVNLVISQILFSISTSAAVFCLAGVFLGAGLAWTTTTMVGHFVGKWFTNSKGSIMGIILAANGLGTALASQVIGNLINSGTHGWRMAYRTSAIIVAVVGLIVVLLIRNDPSDVGTEPMGKDAVAKKKKGANWTGMEFVELTKRWYFYVAILCCFNFGMILSAFTGSSSAHLKDVGIDPVIIKNVMSVYSLLLFVGKTSTGFIFDRKGLRTIMNLCGICGIIACAALIFTTSPVGAWIYCCVVGFALPIETVMMPLLAADLFGQKPYSKTMGIMVGIVQFGFIGGSMIPNAYFDRNQTYIPVFVLFLTVFVISLVVINIVITAAHKERKKLEEAELSLMNK